MSEAPVSNDDPDPRLLPCPFCGKGTTWVHVNHGTWRGVHGYGEPVSVEVRHHCEDIPGQPSSRLLAFVGRDEASAVARWNHRSPA